MTAHLPTAFLAAEISSAGGAREIVLRDRAPAVPGELIIEARPSRIGSHLTWAEIEIWSGTEVVVGAIHLTATQWRALAAFCEAAAQDAEERT